MLFTLGLVGHAALVDVRDSRALANGHAEVGQVVGDFLGEPGAEGGDHPLAGVEQDHPSRRRVDPPEGVPHGARRDRELAGDLDTGGTAADDDERHPLGPPGRIVRALGLFEGAVEAIAQVDDVGERLQATGHLLPLVVAEVGGLAAAGDDQAVVVEAVAAVEDHLPLLGVDLGDLGHQDRGVLAVLEIGPDRGRAIARRQRTRRDLVEERLEQVVVVAVDEGHVRVRVAQLRAAARPPKPLR